MDNSGAIKCDLERQIRSADFKLLQLRTEMQMERHRSAALAEENSDANKKVNLNSIVMEFSTLQVLFCLVIL